MNYDGLYARNEGINGACKTVNTFVFSTDELSFQKKPDFPQHKDMIVYVSIKLNYGCM